MDDLNGLDWSSGTNSSSQPQANAAASAKPAFSYPSLQPTPSPSGSGRSTPLNFNNLQNTGNSSKVLRPGSKPATPANDSFANLLKPGANKQQNTLSLQERQRQLQEEKLRLEEERRKNYEKQFGNQGWDGFGGQQQQRSTNTVSPPPALAAGIGGLSSTINKPFANIPAQARPSRTQESEDDILAAFDSAAPVDASSHMPPPAPPQSMGSANLGSKPAQSSNNGTFDLDDDDDPFGLGQVKQKSAPTAPAPVTSNDNDNDDDDILGMLGRPVSEVRKATPPQPTRKQRSPPPQLEQERDQDFSGHPQAKAVSELVDMGFPADKAADALAQTDTGMNVQAAVSILLNQAHEDARQKARGRSTPSERPSADTERSRRPQREARQDPSVPSWMRDGERERSGSRPSQAGSAGQGPDITKQAQDIGSSLFKSANSLWKQGQKKMQKAMADFQQEGDSSQPKWMRDAQMQEAAAQSRPGPPPRPQNGNGKAPDPGMTNEAMLLEGGGRPQKPPRSAEISRASTPASTSSGQWNDIPDDMLSAPRSRGGSRQPSATRPAAQRLTRQEVEESAEQVFVSSRRRRPAPQASTPPVAASSSPVTSPPLQSRNPFNANPSTSAASSKPSTPLPSQLPARPKAPPRTVPSVSNLALQNSSKQRANGTEAFKRGDYGTAHTHYTSALQGIPTTHPIAIIIFCNRALTSIKNGDPRAAVADADSALATIGVSRGEGEKIPLGGTEGEKDMKEFYGKALMRKAEALEHMEKWFDAGNVWREAVTAGVGGSISIQGRNRCDKATGTGSQSSTPAPRPAPRKPPPRKPASALSALQGTSDGTNSEAVQRMRAANAAAEKADDEKFALTDAVDAKLIAWKGTKADNLRALLGSLDKVLWAEAGWNKVGMQDLVMPNRVKIVYMKAIAKVHPDKISQNATTEQRMVSAAVFATLNEAWDKFKTDNNL